MSIDVLQEKIRKTKNPSVLELAMAVSELPPQFSQNAEGYAAFCRELMTHMKGSLPAVRISFSAFALLGHDGLYHLSETLKKAVELDYYVLLDAPEILSPASAKITAASLLGEGSIYPCDGLLVSGYLGSDVIKSFLPYCKKEKKDLFVVTRTANKSAPELQDLLAGSRLVHMAAADHVNRYGADTAGKFGYTNVGILAAASSATAMIIPMPMQKTAPMVLTNLVTVPQSAAEPASPALGKTRNPTAAIIWTMPKQPQIV